MTRSWGGGIAVGLLLASCRSPDKEPVQDPVLPAPSAPVSSGLDRLAPDELLEGTDTVYALRLPRGVKTRFWFGNTAWAEGPVPLDKATAYVRARVRDGRVLVANDAATFEEVRVPTEPTRYLRIRLTRNEAGTRFELHDATVPPAPDLPDEAARWRAMGLSPEGRPLHPERLE